jgi:hypothetical protein
MSALIALVHVTAQSGGSASANIVEGLALLAADHVAPAGQEVVSTCAEDIGHFQPMLVHGCG